MGDGGGRIGYADGHVPCLAMAIGDSSNGGACVVDCVITGIVGGPNDECSIASEIGGGR